jgi:hypothetical protein
MHFGKFLNALKKINKWHVIALTALLLVANLTMMGISFARYRSAFEGSVEVGVIGFSPALEEDAFEGDFTVPGSKSFTVTNGNGEVALQLKITIETQGVLPLSYRLFMGEEELTLEWNSSESVYISESTTMPVGATEQEFTLISDWEGSMYQEYFGGLSEQVSIRVLCEQLWED